MAVDSEKLSDASDDRSHPKAALDYRKENPDILLIWKLSRLAVAYPGHPGQAYLITLCS